MTNDADPRNRVLDLLSEGKITADEAKSLLALVSGGERSRGDGGGEAREERRDRRERGHSRERDRVRDRQRGRGNSGGVYFRVRVDPRVDAGASPTGDRVNIRVPIGLIKAGARLTSLIPGAAADRVNEMLAERGIDLDFKNLDADRLEEILAEGDFMIDITEGDFRIRISVE